jgi:tRNA threonylcarbamoyladenosine biosynthesis protein TsaB
VALAEADHVSAVRRLDEARRHARDLVPQVAELFGEQKWTPKEIDAVIVSLGPGSYTGLRVGIISAKTFAFATGAKLIGVPTFSAIAMQAPSEATALDVIGDAQQEKIYVQSFRESSTGVIEASTPLAIVLFSDWLAKRHANVWATGPGLRNHASRLADVPCVHSDCWDPRPATLLSAGFRRFGAGAWLDPWSVGPIYLRPSSAEEKMDKRPRADE